MVLISTLVGLLLGALEGLILLLSRQKLSFWVYAQSIIFWFACGVMIALVELPMPSLASGVLVAVLLNAAWYINIAVIPKQYAHLVPLIIASVLLGVVGSLAKMFLSTLQ